ncbi:MAG TPA: FecR domain-containing protein [Flavitalea sp.]|nr:FecR domain-containing protein [Flavitalea sp.]
MTRDEYIELYEKLLAGKCTAEEKELIESYKDDFDWSEKPWGEEMGDKDEIRQVIYKQLRQNLQPKKKSTIRYVFRVAAAAAMLGLALTASLYLLRQQRKTNGKEAPGALVKQVIVPGTNKAILKLSNGATIELDSTHSGVFAKDEGVEIRQTAEGQIAYKKNQKLSSASTINTLSTPVGGQYQLRLEDGTEVWLNAASSISFPTAFSDKERSVEVKGEVYFEVKRDPSKPFKVTFNGNTITVLGTHFNVMAYEDEDLNRVTLLEGSVNLSNASSQSKLVPGQQAVVNRRTSAIENRKVNVEEAIAWKKGFFFFENENIESIMRKLSRWYNTTTDYQGDMKGKEFSGTVSRFENISEVLDLLEETGSIHYKIKARRITIMP